MAETLNARRPLPPPPDLWRGRAATIDLCGGEPPLPDRCAWECHATTTVNGARGSAQSTVAPAAICRSRSGKRGEERRGGEKPLEPLG